MKSKLMVGMFVAIMISGFGASLSAEGPRKVIVLKTQGTVETKMGEEGWKVAEAGMELHQNDEIRTAENATAELLLDEGGATGRLELKEKSRLRINSMELDQATKEKNTVLDLAIGSVLVHAEKLQGDSKFQVRTANSTTGVRGTTFTVSAEPKES